MTIEKSTQYYSTGIFSSLDIHFASFIERLAGGNLPELFLAASLASKHTRDGHICLELSSVAGKRFPQNEDAENTIRCPELADWNEKLISSRVVGKPGEFKPLILDDKSRLYLYRYRDYQDKLARLIQQRINEDEQNVDMESINNHLETLFPTNQEDEIDWQKVAAFCALNKKFCVISGGPGTGKTTTVAKILALLIELAEPGSIRIALAAPTGKAAARMQEAINQAKASLNCSDEIKNAIPDDASTIHRLLGTIPHSPYFRHNADHPLPVDCVVVDEASMVDLALMSKLVQALPSQARLILLGDKDQLASVEAGAVFGDICDRGNIHGFSESMSAQLEKIIGSGLDSYTNQTEQPGIQDCIVQLQKNYRFGLESGIGIVSRMVNTEDGEKAIQLMKDSSYKDIQWHDLPDANALGRDIKNTILQGYSAYLTAENPSETFKLFDRFRILCALREGPYGAVAINRLVEQILRRENLVNPDKQWYHGRPVMITSNDYNLRLFNGDVGIVLRDSDADNELRVFFPDVDGTMRKFHPFRLSEHETVFAMTVHKSQGSEFDDVILLLPDRDSPVLTRELIYTAITRAKNGVVIWGSEQVFCTAVSRQIERTSGLRDALW
jgi:exodeoxyribonuclease V alpha subunit